MVSAPVPAAAAAPPPGGPAPLVLSLEQDDAWREFLGFARELFTALERELLERAGVSVADLEMLEPLLAGPGEGLRAKDLAVAAAWQDSRVSHQVRRMETRGLVERHRAPHDGRGTVVRLTAAGREAATTATATRHETVARLLFAAIDPGQADQLAGISRAVRAVLARDASGPGPDVHFPRS